MTVTEHPMISTPARPEVSAQAERPLAPILAPRSIAVIGASRTPGTIGNQLLTNLIVEGFTGAVYPVNARARSVCSVRAVPRVSDLPETPDLAIVCVPKESVVEVADECGAMGVRGLVVISAGFREVGGAGAGLERALLETVRRHRMRMLGPNCMGVINTHPSVSMNGTFAPGMPPAGHAAFVSQSGALGVSVVDYAREYGIGIAQFASVGNKADVSGNDLLEHWEHDDNVRVILMYVENFGNPRRFLEIASRITRHKPIVVVKSGRSRAGARAAWSHTGALAASDTAVDALLAQAGVLRAGSIEELFDMAMALGVTALPASRRTAVVTNAGGPGILAADALEAAGLDVVELSDVTVAKLRPLFPPEASVRNPLDMIASATPQGYRVAVTALLEDPNVDAVVPIFIPPLNTEQGAVAQAIADAARTNRDKPVLTVLMGRRGLPEGRAELHAAGIPAYVFPESAARALAALNRYREWTVRPIEPPAPLDVDRGAAAAIVRHALDEGREQLSELEALHLLDAYGIGTAAARIATGPEAAAAAAGALGFPVVLKIVSPDVVHKSDVGGVRVGLRSVAEVRAAYDAIVAGVADRVPGARIHGVLVQRMHAGGRETIIGAMRDPSFGPLVMFGLGGLFVEALQDVVFRMPPLDVRTANEMVHSIRGIALLTGARGSAPSDLEALADALRRVGQLATDHPEIAELDVNPLVALDRGVVALDARVRLTAAPAAP
ncbi:MAG TPA: acetate--CoA ligase family protein [Gemmatimonadaceae bacterium]|nr:acetate--CoA ligase family protein [Gemmatimonadaceae bacterium]